jgi:hypothetical protein
VFPASAIILLQSSEYVSVTAIVGGALAFLNRDRATDFNTNGPVRSDQLPGSTVPSSRLPVVATGTNLQHPALVHEYTGG